jgi:hypothetical protein
MAEPTRHILSDNGVWPLCWQGQIPRINQTWNDGCVVSSLEYKCNIPCCIPMDTYLEEYPDNNPPAGTRNETVLDLTDPAWLNHFYYPYCRNNATQAVVPFLNSTTGEPQCVAPSSSAEFAWYGEHASEGAAAWTYFTQLECRCDACVFEETMAYLSPVGDIFTVTLTYTGFVLLAVGALWNANIVKKLKKLSDKCKELKAANQNNNKDEKEKKVRE